MRRLKRPPVRVAGGPLGPDTVRISIGTTQHGTTATLEHHIGVIDDLPSKGARRSACGSAPAAARTRCIASRPSALPASRLARPARNCPAATAQRAPLDSTLHHVYR
jgi:hypothetical protein